MGALSIPLAASGGAAPVTLVEILTGYIPPAAIADPPGVMPPAGPRSLAPGESLAWSYAAVAPAPDTLSVNPNIFSGGLPVSGAASGTRTTGSLGMLNGESLGPNQVGIAWTNFQPPPSLPRGATITGVYPVVIVNALSAGAFMTFSCDSADFGVAMGANVGPDVGTWSGQVIGALIHNTVGGAADLSIGISFIAFAVYYVTPPLGMVVGTGDGDAALSIGTYFWSEHRAMWPSILTGQVEQFLDWITEAPTFRFTGTTQTDTATITIQNVSGNTMQRDATKIFSSNVLIGALCVARIWRGDAEGALLTFIGTITNVDVDDAQMVLTVESFGNYSAVLAPSYNIDKSCPLTFGSTACGSTSPTPCDQSYGGCSSINRFAGAVTQWDTECPNVQIAQPPPAVVRNPARAF